MLPAKLTTRQKNVLAAIVDYYIAKAEPVSSKFLSLRSDFQASSATLRNTMAELEDLGYLEQPHTSAGRMPTDWGYRVYVDQVLQIPALSPDEMHEIEKELQPPDEGDLLSNTAEALSRFSHLLGVALTPALDKGLFKHLKIVTVSEHKILMIVFISDTIIQTILNHPFPQISIFKLEAMANRINDELSGKNVAFLNDYFENKIRIATHEEEKLIFQFYLRSITKLWNAEKAGKIQFYGSAQMLLQPDFGKSENLRGILELLGSQFTLVHFLRQRGDTEGVKVTIGEEHVDGEKFKAISTITASFEMGESHGVLGIIGPKRMPYSKLISIVDFTAKTLSKNYRID